MIGKRALFDSNIIIYLSKKEIPYSYIDQFAEHNISVITYVDDFKKTEVSISDPFE